jgi:N-acyl amino acid synthase of PEP-CTERM/exosortase system
MKTNSLMMERIGTVPTTNRLITQLKNFKIFIAETPQLKKEVFHIRYQVYCEEFGYEPLSKFPDRLERDIYDQRSIHCLLHHEPSGKYVACIRLVLSDTQYPEAKFPFENVCNDHLIDFEQTPRSLFGEVSRLAVLREFRRSPNQENKNNHSLVSNNFKNNQPSLSIIPFSLYLSNIAVGLELGLEYALTFMEPRLARHLRISGLIFRPIGELVDFKGKRAPFIMKKSEILSGISKNTEVFELFQLIQARIKPRNSTEEFFYG